MSGDKLEALKTIRDQVLSESIKYEGKQRFGLFSVPPAGVITNDIADLTHKKKVGPDGKVITAPRNLLPGPARSGKTESSYLSRVGYSTIGSPYLDPDKIPKKIESSLFKSPIKHDNMFKPASGAKSDPCKTLFEHLPEQTFVKKTFKDEGGKVKTEPKNIMTSPAKSGVGATTVRHLFNKPPEHLKDEYDRKKQFDKREKEESFKKMQEAPFKSVIFSKGAFENDKKTYGTTKEMPKPKARTPSPTNKKIHDAPFKPSNPSKIGYNSTLGKYPEYKSDPIKVITRKKTPDVKKDSFKPPKLDGIARPTPSIALHKFNIQRESSSFAASL